MTRRFLKKVVRALAKRIKFVARHNEFVYHLVKFALVAIMPIVMFGISMLSFTIAGLILSVVL